MLLGTSCNVVTKWRWGVWTYVESSGEGNVVVTFLP